MLLLQTNGWRTRERAIELADSDESIELQNIGQRKSDILTPTERMSALRQMIERGFSDWNAYKQKHGKAYADQEVENERMFTYLRNKRQQAVSNVVRATHECGHVCSYWQSMYSDVVIPVGSAELLVSSSKLVDGKRLLFPDDLDFADNDTLLFSDASTRFGISDFLLAFMEYTSDKLEHLFLYIESVGSEPSAMPGEYGDAEKGGHGKMTHGAYSSQEQQTLKETLNDLLLGFNAKFMPKRVFCDSMSNQQKVNGSNSSSGDAGRTKGPKEEKQRPETSL
ncbi:hypothetical protein niasHT_021972 [Heterodera trifolii]|uniref:Uncharacterized protein n=1 Tax=Heterodera trifolii TaxID=157864 RepID=A0ABD2K084_9BILA